MTNGRLITGCLILLLATGPVMAAPFHQSPFYYHPLLVAQRDHAGNGGISLDEAVAQARQRNKGKVLSAETIRVDGRKVHRIKILTKNGRVKRIQIDARSGKKMKRGH
ncbi:MAG: PepSY domain-containing protein [Pseudomonadota bacterium]